MLTADQLELQKHAQMLGREVVLPRAAAYDENSEFPWEMHELFGEQGLYGLIVPEEYGGSGGGALDLAIFLDALGSTGSCGATLTLYEAQSLGSQPLVVAATKEQKQRWLPGVASGDDLWAFGLTEPESGSDVGSMKTTATKVDGGYLINGTKCYCTNGNVADYVVVFAKTDPSQGTPGITAFVVPTSAEGFSVGRLEKKMGLRGSPTAELALADVFVPDSDRLGDEGRGFAIAMQTLLKGRIAVSADSVGIMSFCVAYAAEYAKERTTFGKAIADRQAIQFMLADMDIATETSRQMVFSAARALDAGVQSRRELERATAIAKCYATDQRERVASDAIQVLGGAGYMTDHPLERVYRDSKIFQIFEGTNQIQRMLIARSVLA